MDTTRRTFLKAAGLGVMAFSLGGVEVLLTPRQARAQDASLQILTGAESRTLEAFGEAVLPGAAEAGIANFVDAQLAASPDACKLIARYFDLSFPYTGFYQGALAAVDALSEAQHGVSFADLDVSTARDVVRSLNSGVPEFWEGPPAQLVYLILRADTIDVVYGTMEGYEALGIPYMAHIPPQERW